MPHKLFPSQQPNEKVYLVFREHWFRLLMKFSIVIVLALIPLAIYGFIPGLFSNILGDYSDLIRVIVQLYYLALIVASFVIWVIYYLNMGIVSELRLVDVDQKGLLKHEISELNLDSIEDVTSETIGLFGNLLNYGTVYIQTAGATERFEFDKIHNPKEVAGLILKLYELRKKANPSN